MINATQSAIGRLSKTMKKVLVECVIRGDLEVYNILSIESVSWKAMERRGICRLEGTAPYEVYLTDLGAEVRRVLLVSKRLT